MRVQLQRAIEEERYSSHLLKSHVIQTWLLHRQLQPESYWHPHSYVHDADMTRRPSFATACSSCSRGIRMLLQSRAQTWQAQLGSSASTLGSVWNTGSLGTAQLCMGGGPFSIQLSEAGGCVLRQPCLAPGWMASNVSHPCCAARPTPCAGGTAIAARTRSGRHQLMCPLSNMGRSRPSTMCLWTQGTGQQTQAMRQCQWPMLPMRSCMLHRYSSIPLHCELTEQCAM